MQYVLDFVLASVSTFFIAHLLYIIFNRNYRAAHIFLLLRLLYAIAVIYAVVSYGYAWPEVILTVFIELVPVIGGAIIWAKFAGVPIIPKRKGSSKRAFKSKVKDEVKTSASQKQSLFIFTAFPIIILIIVWFSVQDDILKYVLMGISLLGALLGIFFILDFRKIRKESVVVLIGKQKELIYEYLLPKGQRTVEVKDFFQSDDFIVDQIGTLKLIYPDKTIEKHYLYWIATSQKIEVSNPNLVLQNDAIYQKHLDTFPKYKLTHMTLSVSNDNLTKVLKIKRV